MTKTLEFKPLTISCGLAVVLVLLSVPSGWAQGTGSGTQAPTPAQPLPVPELPEVTAADVAAAVDEYVTSQTGPKGFRIYDSQAKTDAFLQHKRTEQEQLRPLGNGQYIVAAWFESESGSPYELDFLAASLSSGELRVQPGRAWIRVVDGKERFRWEENTTLKIYQRRSVNPIPAAAPVPEAAEEEVDTQE